MKSIARVTTAGLHSPRPFFYHTSFALTPATGGALSASLQEAREEVWGGTGVTCRGCGHVNNMATETRRHHIGETGGDVKTGGG